jgi:lipopolysaccharide export system protein LptA
VDGTVDSAISDSVLITLIDAPLASPTSAPTTVPTTLPATHPSSAPSTLVNGTETDFMKDKLVDTVTLLAKPGENIEVSSISRDQSGAILRAMNLFAPKAIDQKTHDKGKTYDVFTVPSAGRMLVRDERSMGPASAPSDSSAGGMHGTSAFQWQKSLVYDQRADQAVMTGDVQVVHEAPAAASYKMFADSITLYMDPNPHSATRATMVATTGPTSQSTSQPAAGGEEAMKVKRMVAQGQVRMVSQRLQFTAAQAIYDPETQIMTAHGSQRQPGEMLDEQGLSTASFDGLVYNTQTGQVQLDGFNGNVVK